MKPVTEFELKFINEFLTTGIQMIPNPDRSAYESDEIHNWILLVTERLKKFYALYDFKISFHPTGNQDW
jgi:hypothetical protein